MARNPELRYRRYRRNRARGAMMGFREAGHDQTRASEVGVFASGTMRWVCAMRGPHCGHGLTRAAG